MNATSRPGCDGGPLGSCRIRPTWKLREKGDKLERNWFFACGRHLHYTAEEIAGDEQGGPGLDLIRIKTNER
jgi:hypothetical protein